MANLLNHFILRPLMMLVLFVGLGKCLLVVAADEFPLGNKSIYLKDNNGKEFPIRQVSFNSGGNGVIAYELNMDTERFKDFFLSMKEMKCLEGKEIWCFIPYP